MLILLTVCMLIRSMLPILEMSKFLILWIAIVDAIIIFIMLFVTKECHIVINKQKEKVNLDSIKQEAIYLYLIKQKYILKIEITLVSTLLYYNLFNLILLSFMIKVSLHVLLH